jgi:hypothetical protein
MSRRLRRTTPTAHVKLANYSMEYISRSPPNERNAAFSHEISRAFKVPIYDLIIILYREKKETLACPFGETETACAARRRNLLVLSRAVTNK